MPKFDKTGPAGMGPGTGRGNGPCYSGNGSGAGLGWGRGYGRMMCGRGMRRFQTMTGEEKKNLLESEIQGLKEELESAEEELKELGK